MDWWQIVLIILGAIAAGVFMGVLLSHLVARLGKKPLVKERETAAVVEEPLESVTPGAMADVESNRRIATEPRTSKLLSFVARLRKKPLVKERETAAVVEEPLESVIPDLMAEIENNRRIAAGPWTGKLLPFRIDIWDASRDGIHTLPANLGEDLAQAYIDMRLANSIVWLSTELGRRSDNLDNNYTKLRTNIAARLDKIMPLLKQSGE